jgi:hypothetical protein
MNSLAKKRQLLELAPPRMVTNGENVLRKNTKQALGLLILTIGSSLVLALNPSDYASFQDCIEAAKKEVTQGIAEAERGIEEHRGKADEHTSWAQCMLARDFFSLSALKMYTDDCWKHFNGKRNSTSAQQTNAPAYVRSCAPRFQGSSQ